MALGGRVLDGCMRRRSCLAAGRTGRCIPVEVEVHRDLGIDSEAERHGRSLIVSSSGLEY